MIRSGNRAARPLRGRAIAGLWNPIETRKALLICVANQGFTTLGSWGMILSVRGLTKNYGLGEAQIAVLRGVDLDVGEGEMCAVMGPSGVGKSTLLNLVAGLDEPDD